MGLRDQRLPISSSTKSMISMTLRSRNDKNFQYIDENKQKYCRIRRQVTLFKSSLHVFPIFHPIAILTWIQTKYQHKHHKA